MTEESPARNSDQYPLRMPVGMRDRLKDAAAASGRSVNAEIIARIEATFSGETPLASTSAEKLLGQLLDTQLRIEALLKEQQQR